MTIMCHHLTAKLLYLSKRTQPDLQTPVSFLTTCVQSPDVDDWKKLWRCQCFHCDTQNDLLTLQADGSGVIHWWIDASFAIHGNMHSHTGAVMSLGKAVSCQQRINTASPMEAELVGVHDVMGIIHNSVDKKISSGARIQCEWQHCISRQSKHNVARKQWTNVKQQTFLPYQYTLFLCDRQHQE